MKYYRALQAKLDTIFIITNPGGAPELHVPDPGEHVPLLPVRLHLHDHDHHHREVAGRLLPLLLPGDINTNVLFGL